MVVRFLHAIWGFDRGDVVEFDGTPEALEELARYVEWGYLEAVD